MSGQCPPIEINQGSAYTTTVELYEDDAATIPTVLPTGTTARVQYRKQGNGALLLEASDVTVSLGNDTTPAQVSITLTAAETRLITGRRAEWAVEIEPGGDTTTAYEILSGPVHLVAEVVR